MNHFEKSFNFPHIRADDEQPKIQCLTRLNELRSTPEVIITRAFRQSKKE